MKLLNTINVLIALILVIIIAECASAALIAPISTIDLGDADLTNIPSLESKIVNHKFQWGLLTLPVTSYFIPVIGEIKYWPTKRIGAQFLCDIWLIAPQASLVLNVIELNNARVSLFGGETILRDKPSYLHNGFIFETLRDKDYAIIQIRFQPSIYFLYGFGFYLF